LSRLNYTVNSTVLKERTRISSDIDMHFSLHVCPKA